MGKRTLNSSFVCSSMLRALPVSKYYTQRAGESHSKTVFSRCKGMDYDKCFCVVSFFFKPIDQNKIAYYSHPLKIRISINIIKAFKHLSMDPIFYNTNISIIFWSLILVTVVCVSKNPMISIHKLYLLIWAVMMINSGMTFRLHLNSTYLFSSAEPNCWFLYTHFHIGVLLHPCNKLQFIFHRSFSLYQLSGDFYLLVLFFVLF